MSQDFQRAFKARVRRDGVAMTDIARKTGVSLDVLKKLNSSTPRSTTVENGMLIAAYFGETVNQFVTGAEVGPEDRLRNLFELLSPAERQLLEAQISGVVAARGRK